ncbi:putative gustatory receptor 58a [Drosophila ficusphila]|uniref:putative gustatory receptor 58a n=1 Tax=Drosophila ficusphila TaxID=30025 RepID=UPI0007E72630|nr:putative gustatory receptor 58a [Drosophila ficusphila]
MVLKCFYIYGLICGLLPALLENGKFIIRSSQRWYILYTACLHVVLLILLPFTFPNYMYDKSYMSQNPFLQWAFNLTNITRIMSVFSGYCVMWLKRKRLLKLGKNIFHHCLKCKRLENNSRKYTPLWKRTQGLLVQMFFVSNLNILVSAFIMVKITTDRSFNNTTMIIAHVVQYIYIINMMAGVYAILLFLRWQSDRMQIALKDLCSLLNHEERNSLVLSEEKSKIAFDKLHYLFRLHVGNQRLIREVFETLDIPIALLLLKMFVTNINLVYHGVQFGNTSITASNITKFTAICGIICHYWSAILLMNIVDDVTRRSGLKMGNLLREFSHLELVSRNFQLKMELFSDHLRCHPATYKVCGLFVFNKQTSLVYFFYVLVQVSVLVQFDLKKKVE